MRLKQITMASVLLVGLSACGGSSHSTPPLPAPQAGTPQPGMPTPTTDPAFAGVRVAAQEEMDSNQSAGVSVAIYHQGKVVFAEGFGSKRKGTTSPVTADTLFQLGSTTKVLTSLATLQLVENGVLTTDDTLTMALPGIEYPAGQSQGWQSTRIHHLMTHQGGFLDDYNTLSEGDELMGFMQSQHGVNNPQMVEPGRFFNYSNPNFSYLGAIIEYFGQQDYREIMQEKVFQPLGMNRTTMLKNKLENDGDYALGVYQDDRDQSVGYTSIDQIQSSAPVVPAGIYTWSTATELLAMADFLLSGNSDVLSDELRAEITQAQISIDYAGLPLNYGYGIFVDDGFIHQNRWYPEKLWQHGGNTAGYTSKFWILPDKNIAVAILSSGNGDNYARTMVEAIKSVTTLPASEPIPVGKVDTTTFDHHAGTYHTGEMTINVSHNNKVLEVNVPELDAQGVPYSKVLAPVGANTFLATVEGSDNLDLTFFPQQEKGQSVYIRNRGFVGIRAGRRGSVRPAITTTDADASSARKVILN